MNQILFRYLNNLAGKSVCFDSIVIFCAQYLPYLLVLGFILFLIFSKRDKIIKINIFIFVTISVFLARVALTEIIRYFYYVPRPFVNNDIYQLISHEANGSFPSGHAAFFFALATAIILVTRWRTQGIVFSLGAILIIISRVIAGLHWPLDILAGALIGILSPLIIYLFFKKKLQKSLNNIK